MKVLNSGNVQFIVDFEDATLARYGKDTVLKRTIVHVVEKEKTEGFKTVEEILVAIKAKKIEPISTGSTVASPNEPNRFRQGVVVASGRALKGSGKRVKFVQVLVPPNKETPAHVRGIFELMDYPYEAITRLPQLQAITDCRNYYNTKSKV